MQDEARLSKMKEDEARLGKIRQMRQEIAR